MARDVSGGHDLNPTNDGFINMMPTTRSKIIQQSRFFFATKVQFFNQLKWVSISQFGPPKISIATRAAVRIMASKIRVLLRSSLSGESGYWFTLRPDAKAWPCRNADVTHEKLTDGEEIRCNVVYWLYENLWFFIDQKWRKHDLGSNNVCFTNTTGGFMRFGGRQRTCQGCSIWGQILGIPLKEGECNIM